jgi:hypothetical protein
MRPNNTRLSEPAEITPPKNTVPSPIFGHKLSRHGRPKELPTKRSGTADCLRNWSVLLLATLLVVGFWVSPSVADDLLPTDCNACHGTFSDVHGGVTHHATPPSDKVVLFADDDHDEAGWKGTKPYFAVTVDCTTCHNTTLPAVHSNDCTGCHPNPYSTLGTWNGGCQQGGCHTVFHENSIQAHLPFSNAYDSENDCTRCHDATTWAVLQTNCLNCHAAPGTGYVNPPATTSDVQSIYNGAAQIKLSIKEDGKVGIGRTYYKLDDGTTTSGSKVLVKTAGSHKLEFWSIDQYGKPEPATNTVYFTVIEDTTPPTTTSNAQSSYSQGAVITLTATDDSTLGVQNTYYTLNGGTTQTGTTVNIPVTSGVIDYTLGFWSVDWSGNIEAKHTVTFTVTSGAGNISLIFGGNDGSTPLPFPEAWTEWTIRRGSVLGPVVTSGSGSYPTWTGVNNVTLSISSTPYFVRVKWNAWWEGYYEVTDFPNIYVTAPGQTIPLYYP